MGIKSGQNFIGVTICDSDIGITWVQVSRLPMLHTDKTDRNAPCSLIKFIFQYVSVTRSYQLTYIQGEQYNMMVYSIVINSNHKMVVKIENDKYSQTFLLKGEW